MANVLIVCIIYGGGVPLLYPSAACVLLIRFWWDKLVLFRMSAVPNLFHARVMDMLVPWLTAAVTLNLVLSTWMFSKDMFLDWDLVKSFQKVIGVPSGTVDTSVVIGGRSLGSIGNRLCTVHMIPLVVFTVILLAVLAAAGLVRLMKAIVYIASGGTRCSAPDMSDIKVVQRRTVVDHSLGSQCLLYGGRRRVKRTRVATEAGMGLKDYDPETVDDHVIAQVARTIETTVRFAVEDDIGAAAAADEEFPGV